jgi:hypothetical protein
MRRLPAVKGCIVIDDTGKVAFKGKGAMMRVQAEETSTSVIAFGPKKAPTDATMVADDRASAADPTDDDTDRLAVRRCLHQSGMSVAVDAMTSSARRAEWA